MNISGEWLFTETFDGGVDAGTATFIQNGSDISGSMTFTESIEDESPFKVRCEVIGQVLENAVKLKTTSYKILEGDATIEYLMEEKEGIINSRGQIVGSSQDEDGVSGIFTFTKKE